ncbi:DUF3618 domain-containing protein [Mycolicibacterium sediminis]
MPDDPRPEPDEDAGVDELQADIEATREELADTVSALADKVDVKARAHDKAEEAKAAVAQKAHDVGSGIDANRGSAAGIAVGVLVVVGLLAWWRRRRR